MLREPLRRYNDDALQRLIAGIAHRQYESYNEAEEEVRTQRPISIWFNLNCNLTIPTGTSLSQIRSLFSEFAHQSPSSIDNDYLAQVDHPLIPRTNVSDDLGKTRRTIYDGRVSSWQDAPNMIANDLRVGTDVCVIASRQDVFNRINTMLGKTQVDTPESEHLYYFHIPNPTVDHI